MNIFAKGKKQIILRREDLVKNTRLPSKELSKLFLGNTHFLEHYHKKSLLAQLQIVYCALLTLLLFHFGNDLNLNES